MAAFHSVHAPRIWDDLYTALIPDQLTLNPEYIRIFGIRSSGDKNIDTMMSTNLTTVKIPIIKILEYFDNGITVEIPKRESMLEIHKNIELYLGEWRHHIETAVNNDLDQYKELVLGLEKLSKHIYGKASDKEVVVNPMLKTKFGLLHPLAQQKLEQEKVTKPDYQGISTLIRQRTRGSRY